MECAHPQTPGHLGADKPLDALAHLARSLVGEGERHDAVGLVAVGEQMDNLICEHASLARAGPGDYKLGTAEVFDGLTLLDIEFRKILLHFAMGITG